MQFESITPSRMARNNDKTEPTVERTEFSHTVDESVNWCHHFGKLLIMPPKAEDIHSQ